MKRAPPVPRSGASSRLVSDGPRTAQPGVADVARLRPAAILALQRTIGNHAVGRLLSATPYVQRFADYRPAGAQNGRGETVWDTGLSDPIRVSDDGTMAVLQESVAGSQHFYVDDARIAAANNALRTARAPVGLADAGGSVEGPSPKNLDGPKKKLAEVEPFHPAHVFDDFKIPNDCGQAACTVTGAKAQGKHLAAQYQDPSDATKKTPAEDPELMKYRIMVDHFSASIPNAATIMQRVSDKFDSVHDLSRKIKPFRDEIKNAQSDVRVAEGMVQRVSAKVKKAEQDYEATLAGISFFSLSKDTQRKAALDVFEAAKADLQAEMGAAVQALVDAKNALDAVMGQPVDGRTLKDVVTDYSKDLRDMDKLVDDIMKPYNELKAAPKEALDKKVGINRFADPGVGEAYTISSGGPPKKDSKGKDIMTWNFHWGGVVMKSTTGSDNVTLENYAGSADSEWLFQMYGVPTDDDARKGQTFHEQHRDTHRQHGESPTTLKTVKE